MKWLKSTTQKTWTINGKMIPACVTPHNDYLIVDDSEYNSIVATPVIKSLIKAGGILVLSEEPAELKNSMSNLQTSNAALQMRNTQLEEELKVLKASKESNNEVEELKAQAIAELQEKQEEIDALKAQLEALQAKKSSKKSTSGDE